MLGKLNNFSVGYRKGVLFVLTELLKNCGDNKIIVNKQRIQAKVFLQAILDNLDLFLDYGFPFIVFTEWDKKHIPIKAKTYKSYKQWRKSGGKDEIGK